MRQYAFVSDMDMSAASLDKDTERRPVGLSLCRFLGETSGAGTSEMFPR